MQFILHIDMNSYFASVEQQANPILRGKPIGVCAYLPRPGSTNGAIIAASKEAKKMGVKTAMSIALAKHLCPQIILIENEPAKYRSTTERLVRIYQDYTDRIENYSIDESFLDLTGYIKSWAEGEKIISEIKKRIKSEVGEWLTSSAGLSWTRWLAKFGSDVCGKDSQLIIDTHEKAEEVFKSVHITEAWGIKEPTQYRLNQLGIFTLMDLKKYPIANLLRTMGKPGYYLWANVNGIETEGVRTNEERLPKSIGHTYCIPKQTNDLKYLASVLMKLCERAGYRLRCQGLEGMSIFAGYSVKNAQGLYFSHRQKFPLYTSHDIFQAAWRVFTRQPIENKVTYLAVSVSDLRPLSNQLSIFANDQKQKMLSDSVDEVNDKYGEFTLIPGLMWETDGLAQDRVGFRKTISMTDKQDVQRYVDESY